VDGVNPLNAGRLFLNQGRYFAPATPSGGVEVLRRFGIEIAGRRAVVVGRSAIVGRPLAMLLLGFDASVTVCHSRTVDLGAITRQADILAVAIGRPGRITADLVAPGATVLDFGFNVVDGAVVGDVDFPGVAAIAGAITPVPGGTGPMTNAVLLRHTLQAAEWQAGIR
jgi:methylenetetrahydrofolate dehydrogenase (NADP+)/methenyltetrahydrofolate cyclohydrolase